MSVSRRPPVPVRVTFAAASEAFTSASAAGADAPALTIALLGRPLTPTSKLAAKPAAALPVTVATS